MEYKIIIPSYQRSTTITTKTLKVLQEQKIPSNKIYIFVANQTEKKQYLKTVPSEYHSHIIVGRKGLRNQRNFITTYFSEGEFLVQMDDDISQIWELTNSGNNYQHKKDHKLIPLQNLDTFLKKTYQLMISHGIYLFGVYPVDNPYFMTNKYTTDLRFIVGPFWGVINRHLPSLRIDLDEKEDVLRTLLYYRQDGQVLRYNNITITTPYYTEKGGMQSENKDRKMESLKSAQLLVSRFPQYCHLKPKKKKNGHTEVILKDKSISIKKTMKKKNNNF